MGLKVGEIPEEAIFWTQKEKQEDEKPSRRERVTCKAEDSSTVTRKTSSGKGCKYSLNMVKSSSYFECSFKSKSSALLCIYLRHICCKTAYSTLHCRYRRQSYCHLSQHIPYLRLIPKLTVIIPFPTELPPDPWKTWLRLQPSLCGAGASANCASAMDEAAQTAVLASFQTKMWQPCILFFEPGRR